MRVLSSSFLIATFVAVFTDAAALHSCAANCIGKGIAVTECSSADSHCICSSDLFMSTVTQCVPQSCSTEEQEPAISFAQEFCTKIELVKRREPYKDWTEEHKQHHKFRHWKMEQKKQHPGIQLPKWHWYKHHELGYPHHPHPHAPTKTHHHHHTGTRPHTHHHEHTQTVIPYSYGSK